MRPCPISRLAGIIKLLLSWEGVTKRVKVLNGWNLSRCEESDRDIVRKAPEPANHFDRIRMGVLGPSNAGKQPIVLLVVATIQELLEER